MATGDKKNASRKLARSQLKKLKETAKRLSTALRQNLHRRKEQARARKSNDTADIEANKKQ